MKTKSNLILMVFAILALASCSEDFLDKDFRSNVSGNTLQDLAASNPEALLTITSGIEAGNQFFLNDFSTAGHGNMHDEFGHMAYNLGFDLMSNDVVQTLSHWFVNYYNYTARIETSLRTDAVWQFYYRVIYNMNDGIRLIPADAIDSQLRHVRGRMLTMRAFAYFQLIRVYSNGDMGIPLYTDESASGARESVEDIKALILSDLEEAHTLLADYNRANKTLVNQSVVSGLLARYHLEYGSNTLAASYAAQARNGFPLMGTTGLYDGFNKISNAEWMWGADINTATSTYYASFFSHMGNLNAGYAGLLQSYKSVDRRIFDQISATDARKSWFVDDGNPFGLPKYANTKFIDDTDFEGDYVFMRAAEMYLIEAEAKALSGDNQGAQQALYQLVVTRDPSYTQSTNTGEDLLNEIRFHRKLELWGEGFAFFDMKRWGTGLNRTYSGSNHASFGFFDYPSSSPKFIFQIPLSEINANSDIGEQNPF